MMIQKLLHIPFIILFLTTLNTFTSKSATLGPNESELKFSHYTSRIGLSQNHITSIFQDQTGFMWIGTFNGLNRFDGYKFKCYYSQPDNPKTLSQNTINVIFQDSKKDLWIGTDKGLNKYDEKTETFKQYYHLNDSGKISIENNIRTIYEDSNGVFWIGFYGGGIRIFHPSNGKFEEIPELQSQLNTLGLSKVNAFLADSKGTYWIGTELGGLIAYAPTSKRITQYLPSNILQNTVSHRIISALIEDKNGNIWIGTWGNGLDMFDRRTNTFTHFRYAKGGTNTIASNTITSLLLDKKGMLWMGTFDNGVTSYDTKTGKFSSFANNPSDINSISHNVVWRIFQDKSGVFWFGTFGGGLNKYNPDAANFESYKVDVSKNHWLNNNQVNALLETSDGDLYLGTYGGGINKFDRIKREFSYILNDSNSLGKIIRVLYEDSRKNIWVSTDQGVFKFDNNLKKSLFFKYNLNSKSIGDKSVYSILEDDNGDIWFGIWNGGIKILRTAEMIKENASSMIFEELTNEKFSNSTVWALYKDTESAIWVGSNNSIYRYNKASESFESFDKEIKEFDKELTISANCFFEDIDQEKMWFGTLNNGVGCYEKSSKKITFLSKKNGLAHDEVFSILPDNKSNLWICTTYGLSQYNQRLKVFRNFDITNGGSHNELLNKSWLLKTKEIIIGGNKGFYIFNPDEIHDNVKPSPIVITDFKIFNKSIDTYGKNSPLKCQVNFADEINISETDNVFSFEFSILDYRFSEKNEYQYMLEGFDKEWNIASIDNRVVTYTNLEGGTYVLKIKGCNSDGIWNNEEKSIIINITPKFYKTWWFKFIFGAIILSIFWLVIQQRFNKLKKQIKEKHHNQNIQKLIDERGTLTLLNNELESDLEEKVKELAAVKLYIQNKDENLTKLRTELQEILDQVKTTLRPQVIAIIKSIDQELKQKKGWDAFKENIDVLQNDLIKRLADEFPKLTQKDLIVCTHIRMAKTNKDIATQLNISLQSVEMARYRIRKKMDLDPKITLNDFLARY